MTSENRKSLESLMTVSSVVFFLIVFAGYGWARAEDSDVIETEINLDQMVDRPQGKGSGPTTTVPAKKTGASLAGTSATDKSSVVVGEEQLMMINENLKNAIEENKKLTQDNKAMTDQLRSLRGSSEITASRVNFLTTQREDLQKRIAEMENQSKEHKQQNEGHNNTVAEKEKEFDTKLIEIGEESKKQEKQDEEAVANILNLGKGKEGAKDSALLREKAKTSMDKFESSTQKIASRVGGLQRENKKLKIDSARLHYNLANTFFEQGKYDRAASEYKKVVELMPYDAEAHYNLAFVSGEFLNDFATSLEHYQQYIYLNPYAEDALLVKEKILEAKLELQSKVDSRLDKTK